ncbi:MAG: type II secretion system protein [Chthoniobacteraceae bacterium]
MKTITPVQWPAFPVFRKNRPVAFTLIELLVVISIIAILAGIALPVMTIVQIHAAQTRDLSNAKQVGLGLRLYAADNNGFFPTAATSANSAFLNVVPVYVPSQKLFYLAGSGWSTGNHAVEYGTSGTLAAGQNNYAYVSGLQDSNNSNYPLMADGFTSGSPGVYNSVQGTKGGVWKGTKAIVVRVDDSVTIEAVSNTDYKVNANGANTDSPSTDIFTPGVTWMPSATVLNPQ